MNPLPRFIAIMLFTVLAALVVILGLPVWHGLQNAERNPPAKQEGSAAAAEPTGNPGSARARLLSQRAALVLAVTGFALTVALILSQVLRSAPSESRAPFNVARSEIGTLAKLAESSVAQGEELTRERDVRRRAEEDARLKQQLLTQSLDEKIRLGHDLHDGIIQSLYAVGLTLESVRALVRHQPEEADRRLEATRTALNDAIRDVRAYIVGLAPENLRRAGFAHAVSAMLNELRAGREAHFDIAIDDDAAALLTPEQSVEALQIAREAVSNALRHGQASVITLRLHRSEREVGLLIQDNGAGFNADHRRAGGHGLGNMHARARRIGGALQVTSAPGAGARIQATVPVLQPSVV